MFKRTLYNIGIALDAIKTNKLKSSLTGLGIMFGVSAVISMLAIGSGAKQEILKQIETLGSNNIVIDARYEENKQEGDEEEENSSNGQESKKFTPGLNRIDYEAIKEIVPGLHKISPEIILNSQIIYRDKRMQGQCIGVSNDYFDIYNMELNKGVFFNSMQIRNGQPVCILGGDLAGKLFRSDSPIGKAVKFGSVWLEVIGILEKERVSNINTEKYGFNNLNNAIFVPDKTLLLRMMDRKRVSFTPSRSEGYRISGGGFFISDQQSDEKNYHQFDRIIVKVENSSKLSSTADLIDRILKRRHNQIKDYEIIVPELLIKQKQEANEMFNFVLGAIAGISLLVGGIGIMNIMFATVMERIREIGIRMAIGAKKKDIMEQFLIEAVFISLIGGVLGIFLGLGLSESIKNLTDIDTHVTVGSVLLSFIVSASVGIIFGYSPAKIAAEKDPIESLRHE
jgi:putative ABC transport system permease protein